MFRKMRRFKQELGHEECVRILKEQKRGVLSLLGDDGYPYGIPIDYWYSEEDNKLYFHGAGEGGQRAVQNLDGIANLIVDDDLLLLHAHGVHFFVRQGRGVVAGRTDEAGNAPDVPDHMPGVVAVDHLHQHIAGVDLPVEGLAHAGLGDLGDGLQGDGDGQNHVVQASGFDGFLDGSLDSVLITGIGMHNIPLCSFCHRRLLSVEGADQSVNADLSDKVEQPDEHAYGHNAAGDDHGVLQNLLGGGPDDLLQFAAQLTEVLGNLAPGSLEPVFLFDFSHELRASLLGLVVDGVLLAESAILLHLETVGVILLVLHGVVVSLLALRASQSDFHAHNGTSLTLPPCITPASKNLDSGHYIFPLRG